MKQDKLRGKFYEENINFAVNSWAFEQKLLIKMFVTFSGSMGCFGRTINIWKSRDKTDRARIYAQGKEKIRFLRLLVWVELIRGNENFDLDYPGKEILLHNS